MQHSQAVKQQQQYFDAQQLVKSNSYQEEVDSLLASCDELREERDNAKALLRQVGTDNVLMRSELSQKEELLRQSLESVEDLHKSLGRVKQSKRALMNEYQDLEFYAQQSGVDLAQRDVGTELMQTQQKLLQLESAITDSQHREAAANRSFIEATMTHESTVLDLRTQLAETQRAVHFSQAELLSVQNSQNDLQSGDLRNTSPALDAKLQAIQDEIQIVQNNQLAQQEQMQS